MRFNTYGAYDSLASFYAITFQVSPSGQEEKIKTPLYENIKVKYKFLKNSVSKNGAQEVFLNDLKVITPPEYGDAQKGDIIRISEEDYVIVRKLEKRYANTIISINYYGALF